MLLEKIITQKCSREKVSRNSLENIFLGVIEDVFIIVTEIRKRMLFRLDFIKK